MINTQMKPYNYSLYGSLNEYGEPTTSAAAGTIKMAINIISQQVAENAPYSQASYIGLTTDKTIKDNFIIHFKDSKLKVLYVNDIGRYSQVYLQKVE